MAPIDPHSYTDSSHPLTEHIHLTFLLDFQSKLIDGTALFTLPRPHEGHIFLDTRDLAVHSVSDDKGKPLDFCIGEADPIKGSLLSVKLQGNQKFLVSFRTSTGASALQWLDPEQTADAKMPYVFTQCQAIHARSIFPCQDTPAARIRYSAEVDVPKEMRVVMSAAYVGRTEGGSRAVDTFKMEQPIPPYLFALAAGDIVYKDLSPRSRVYAEPSVVESAAYEFQGTEQMMQQAEALFGPYDWERFDLLVMPPSFPYGGMENPRMVFLTPAVIVGDRSGVQVVAHELAHSWTGNLITNSSANDFWLNEGFTTYAERRIVEVLDGEERLFLHLGLGWNGLHEEIERFKDRPEFTRLKTDQENVDPDEIYSQVPYEKGCFFVRRLEKEVGRPGFDAFLKNYIKTFRFQSIDTEKFLEFLKQHLPGIEGKVDLQEWVYGVGIPSDAEKPKSLILETVLNLVEEFKLLVSGTEKEQWNTYMDSLKNSAKNWQVQEWQVYLESLPKKVHLKALEDLDKEFELSKSNNWEIRVAFLVLAANSGYEPCMVTVEHALLSFGRMRYLRPLYSGLLQGSPKSKQFALKIYEKAKSKYHPIARRVVQGLITNYTS